MKKSPGTGKRPVIIFVDEPAEECDHLMGAFGNNEYSRDEGFQIVSKSELITALKRHPTCIDGEDFLRFYFCPYEGCGTVIKWEWEDIKALHL